MTIIGGREHSISTQFLTDERARGFVVSDVSETRYSGFLPDDQESHGMALRFIARGSRVLDIGCGTAEFARSLRDQLECDVVGIEPHEGRAALARSHGLTVVGGYLTSQVVASQMPVDVVLFLDVLEHVPDPVELLSLAAVGLKAGGLIIVSVPNVAHWTVRLKLLAGRFEYRPTGIMDATHLRWFTQKTIADVIRVAGLRIQYQEVSRGHWLPVYGNRLPWRHLPHGPRRKVIDWLCRYKPGLFGCQHFLVAVKD